jgi:hypothetical protein
MAGHEIDDNTEDVRIFRQIQTSQKIIVLRPVFLYCSCQLCYLLFFGVPLPLLLYPKGQDYKECNRVSYNMIPIRTLSLLTYFTYIFIDIIIYALGSMS